MKRDFRILSPARMCELGRTSYSEELMKAHMSGDAYSCHVLFLRSKLHMYRLPNSLWVLGVKVYCGWLLSWIRSSQNGYSLEYGYSGTVRWGCFLTYMGLKTKNQHSLPWVQLGSNKDLHKTKNLGRHYTSSVCAPACCILCAILLRMAPQCRTGGRHELVIRIFHNMCQNNRYIWPH